MSIPTSFPKTIEAIYIIANSPNTLFRMLRENYFIANDLVKFDTDDLINEFKKRASDDKSKGTPEIAQLYSIAVALAIKNRDSEKIKKFFEEVSKIKFEWFSDIANIYLSAESGPTFNVYKIPPTVTNNKASTPNQKIITQYKTFNV